MILKGQVLLCLSLDPSHRGFQGAGMLQDAQSYGLDAFLSWLVGIQIFGVGWEFMLVFSEKAAKLGPASVLLAPDESYLTTLQVVPPMSNNLQLRVSKKGRIRHLERVDFGTDISHSSARKECFPKPRSAIPTHVE